MSRRELDRAAVLARVKSGSSTLAEVTTLLGVSYRQAKRLYARYKARGASGLKHAGAGRPSNRSHPSAEREMVISLVRDRYGGEKSKGALQPFGPTFTAEHLWSDHGVLVPVNTLSRWMSDEGLWSRARKRQSSQHRRRARRDHFGELVQLDGSFHDWFEGRGGISKGCLMTMVDDAQGETLLSMDKEETTWAAANALKGWISKYGVPRALYTDWKNVYKRVPTSSELSRGETEVFTQFGRMCRKLAIEVIAASSPQAKGRVERAHGTHQDRLVKKLRLKCIDSYEAANEYFRSEYAAAHNKRFSVAPASPVDYHARRDRRALPDDDVFCLESARIVGNDHVVQYGARGLQLDRVVPGRVPGEMEGAGA
ncbi:MAG: ISNCY family transposase [Gemmatimonadaceae bacterium]